MEVTTHTGSGHACFLDGRGTAASFKQPCGLAVDSKDNIIVADSHNHRIRRIARDGTVTTLAGNGAAGFADGHGPTAILNDPTDVVVDAYDNVIFSDSGNHRIRRIACDGSVTTVAGRGIPAWDDGVGIGASFDYPVGVAVDKDGNVFVCDSKNHCVRKISPNGLVTTLAGTGTASYAEGPGNVACFDCPWGVAVDAENNVYVADHGNHRVRKIASDGNVSTIAGTGEDCFCDGIGEAASFNNPEFLALGDNSNIIVCDCSNNRVRMIDRDGVVTTLAGSGSNQSTDGRGTNASFSDPGGVAVGSDGSVFVAEYSAHKIRKIDAQLYPFGFSPQMPSSRTSEMEELLGDQTDADVTFVVGSDRVKVTAHRLVLATRCAYFKAMLRSQFREGQPGVEIEICDTTVHAFRSLLRYLYTDQLVFEDSELVDVLRKAREIDLVRVSHYCEHRLRKSFKISNAIELLMQADKLGLEDLRRHALRFVTSRLRTIHAEAKDTLGLLKENPDLLLEVMVGSL